MKKEVVKHLVVINNNVVAECLNTEVAKVLVDALTSRLASEKNVNVSYVKQTSEVEVPDEKSDKKKKMN